MSHDFKAAVVVKGKARAMDPGGIGAVLARKFSNMGGQNLRRSVSASAHAKGGWRIISSSDDVFAHKVVVAAGAWSVKLLQSLGFTAPLAAEWGYHVMVPDSGVTFTNSLLVMDNYIVASSMEKLSGSAA